MVVDDAWHHVVMQTDGSTTSVYVDGALDGSKPQTLVVGNGSSDNKIYMGDNIISTGSFLGALNDVRIYDRVLTQAEIDTLSSGLFTNLPQEVVATQSGVKAYPNPSHGRVSLEVGGEQVMESVVVMDVAGQVVQNIRPTAGNRVELELTGPAGFYFIRSTGPDWTHTNRVVLQ